MTPLWEDFIRLGPAGCLGIRLPSGEAAMSRALLSALRLSSGAEPRTLDQWRELCHPSDHGQMQELDRALADKGRETLSLTRRLYCGDGVYRPFRLEACIQRDADGTPRYLMGLETLLENRPAGQERRLRVLREVHALEEENLLLRRALQRRAFQPAAPSEGGAGVTLGVLGLAGSGRSELMRVLSGEGLLPEGFTLTETPGEGDIVLYTIPLRGRLKTADADLLNAAARRGQKIIVLLTMTDLERDETEAGRVLLPRQQRLERALRDLREELERASIPLCPLIPVSPHLAWRGLYDRASAAWRESNFDELLWQLAPSRLPVPETSVPHREEREAGTMSQAGLFNALLLSLREQALRTRFLALKELRDRRFVLMDLNRQDSLRMVCRLAHNSSLFGEETAPHSGFPTDPRSGFPTDPHSGLPTAAHSWLFFGRGEAPFPCVRQQGELEGFDLLVAPENAGGTEWEALFAHWTPVVHMDLIRVDSSLSELARAPWFSALASAPRWVLAFAHGGLFDTRLSGLLEAEERVMRFAILRGFQGRMTPFVYENYDPRYTDFLELGARVRCDATAEELGALVAGWGRDELDYAPPFTRDQLALALLGIRNKLQRIRQKIVK